jgi:hypothetical protein
MSPARDDFVSLRDGISPVIEYASPRQQACNDAPI